ncbi:MAG: hypothetical protein KDC43_06060 [Saprospiraceae bacterium]|nr:hypothetical protein [Saprospiraceae bacterium]MCB0623479.1 hypothetical protein [Saprospiraceae bacterium]MCB0676446.1 hypothetical protein [Saprospiraceae bacterium]MCB0683466.1 hypothetical protein [Saprospiraceae bacterium]
MNKARSIFRLRSGLLFALLFTLSFLQAQTGQELPKVFVIGEYEQQYEALLPEYQRSLLQVCQNDTKKAFQLWVSLIQEIEAYGKQVGYDLNGLKCWFHVFFSADGRIRHIAYHLRPTSRNVEEKGLTEFLTGFVQNYSLPVSSTSNYYNYTSIQFPVIYNLPDSASNGN